MQFQEIKTFFSWSANSTVNVPILFTIFGFVYSIYIFNIEFDKVYFYDLRFINEDSLSSAVVNHRIEKIEDYIRSNDSFKNLKDENNKYYFAQYHYANTLLIRSKREINDILNGTNSVMAFSEYANINYEELRDFLTTLRIGNNKADIWTIPVILRDTSTIPTYNLFDKEVNLRFKVKERTLLEIINYNSYLGFWFFLSIVQMCFWFLLIPLLIGTVKQTDLIGLKYNLRSALVFCIIPAVFVGLFSYFLYWKLIDSFFIQDIYVLKDFNYKMLIYSIPGYITAILCFSTYLFISNKIELIYSSAGTSEEKKWKYQKLISVFRFSFMCSAIVLTIFVFWLAFLINGINDNEIFRFYKLVSGVSFLNNDLVYLMGLMHSLLLVLFYFPVKVRFSSLNISQEQERFEPEGLGRNTKVWKNVLELFYAILVTSSPLIAAIVQSLIDILSF